MVLPHVFGEFGRPFHNSVVSTFSYQLARGETPKVTQDKELELLHASDLADQILFWEKESGALANHQPAGQKILVSELLKRLQDIHARYLKGSLFTASDSLDAKLLRTVRSYLDVAQYPLHVRSTLGTRLTLEPGQVRHLNPHRKNLTRVLLKSGQLGVQFQRPLILFPELPSWNFPAQKPGEIMDIPSHYAAQLIAYSRCEIVLSP